MADPKKNDAAKSGEGKKMETIPPREVASVNPRGAENKEPFDKDPSIERRDNQLGDESGQGNTNLPPGTVKDTGAGKSFTGTVRQPGSTKAAGEEEQEGFTSFNIDMVSLTELYSNIRDGNYWSAFRRAVEILYTNMVNDPRAVRGTPTQRANARIAARAQQPVKRSQIMEMEEKLNECCDDLEKQQTMQLRTGNKEAVGASQEKNVGKVDLAGLIALVRMILGLFKDNS